MNKKSLLIIFCTFVISIFSSAADTQNTNAETSLLVHKTPTCGCCKMWVEHLKMNGLKANTQDHENLDEIKKMYGIKPQSVSYTHLTLPTKRIV